MLSILIIAAGSSSRLGKPKQLVIFQEKTLIERTVETALQVSENVAVVLGANDELISPFLQKYPIKILHNSIWVEGMASSIRLGVESLGNQADKVLLLLCDQPFVSVDLLQEMIQIQHKIQSPIVACEYAGALGVPMLFDRTIFPELLALKGDKGARAFLHKYPNQISIVSFEKGIFDVDTEEDLLQLIGNN